MYLYNNSERNPIFSHVMLHPVEKLEHVPKLPIVSNLIYAYFD